MNRPIVKNAMSRNKFELLKRYLHLSDNTKLDLSDKFAKLRPYFDLLNRSFIKFGVFSQHLSIDEQMIPYFGKHSCKMYIRGKPIRFGYKLWCMCSAEGFLYQFIPYAGAGGYDKQIGLGADIVMQLLSHVEFPMRHDVFFDNFFTSYHLMCLLSERRFCAAGTVRENRVSGAPLNGGKKKKGNKPLPRGAMDYAFDKTNSILMVRWSDNKEVTLATNHIAIEPMAKTKRYDKEQKKKVEVPVARVISEYNRYMGGVDLHDNGVCNYRVAIRGKKWWWTLFIAGLNSAIVNAWKLHCLMVKTRNEVVKTKPEKPMSQIDFRVSVTEALLLTEDPDSENLDFDDSEVDDDDDIVLPAVKGKHLIGRDPMEKRKRCGVCHKKTIFLCVKCKKALHPKCFSGWSPHLHLD